MLSKYTMVAYARGSLLMLYVSEVTWPALMARHHQLDKSQILWKRQRVCTVFPVSLKGLQAPFATRLAPSAGASRQEASRPPGDINRFRFHSKKAASCQLKNILA